MRRAFGAAAFLLAACGGGGGGDGDGSGDPGDAFFGIAVSPSVNAPGFGAADDPNLPLLSPSDVSAVLDDAVAEAAARGAPATIAVVDRVGNVLAVAQMAGAPTGLQARALASADGSGLDGLFVPDGAPVGAIAKAITGAYLSSSGNAFSTRTASQIIQENFNPQESGQFGGPLFGVQFSQLPCSDLNTQFQDTATGGILSETIGPKRSPLGLAGDPGGLPLYKDGVVVGGVGVIADGVYGIDRVPQDRESEAEKVDELIALAGTRRFLPDIGITAPRITVEGKTLRYLDGELDGELALLRSAAGSGAFDPATLVGVPGYYRRADRLRQGTAYGDPQSGYVQRATIPNSPYRSQSAYVLVDAAGQPRFDPRPGTDAPGGAAANRLTGPEVTRIIDEALGLALAGRAQIRRPIGSRLQVTVSVVDTNGAVLGLARTPDAPIFGTDVAVQKARSAMFFSSREAERDLRSVGPVDSADLLQALGTSLEGGLIEDETGAFTQRVTLPPLGRYVDAAEDFFGRDVLSGQVAFTARAIGNIARPFFPDGINGEDPGPLSREFAAADPTEAWSPFSTGLQFDLVGRDILQHVLAILQVSADVGPSGLVPDTPASAGCTQIAARDASTPPMFTRSPLANGLQIFAGSIPIYRNGVLVGAIGVSGDGIDQDDMVAALGFDRAARALNTGLEAGDPSIRSDRLTPQGVRLRYVSCPFEPFLGSDAQNVCEGV